MSEEQLDLFEGLSEERTPEKTEQEESLEVETTYTEGVSPYEVGDIVRVNITITPDEDPESYYYLEGIGKKKGMIKEVIPKPRLQYKVLFGDNLVYLYHEEVL